MNEFTYAHMCRMDHAQIGHNDSSEERCPLCRVIDARLDLEERLAQAEQERDRLKWMIDDTQRRVCRLFCRPHRAEGHCEWCSQLIEATETLTAVNKNIDRSLEAQLEAARGEVARAQNWIRQNSEKWSGDWACATCKPHSDMIVKDFKCAVCTAREQLSAKEGE